MTKCDFKSIVGHDILVMMEEEAMNQNMELDYLSSNLASRIVNRAFNWNDAIIKDVEYWAELYDDLACAELEIIENQ